MQLQFSNKKQLKFINLIFYPPIYLNMSCSCLAIFLQQIAQRTSAKITANFFSKFDIDIFTFKRICDFAIQRWVYFFKILKCKNLFKSDGHLVFDKLIKYICFNFFILDWKKILLILIKSLSYLFFIKIQ